MELFQACLTEALKFVLLAVIAGVGVICRTHLIPILNNMLSNLKKTGESIGLQLTNEQLATARALIKDLVMSAYRLKLGDKVIDAKVYVNSLAKSELDKLGIKLDAELIDEIRRAALGELEQTLQELKTEE